MTSPPSLRPEQVFRTPECRFAIVPDFAYEPKYDHWGNLRYAYIDLVGPVIDLKTGRVAEDNHPPFNTHTETVLCLHGEPTWSFLYRKLIPGFLSSLAPRPNISHDRRFVRRRVIVPDLLGFGRSDKPIDDEFYTWDMHRSWLMHFVQTHLIDRVKDARQSRVTLVVQDWGGILGLLLPSLFPALITHLIVLNTALGVGKMPSKAWIAFRDFIKRSPDVDVGALLARGTPLSDAEVEAYRAPFEGERSKAGVRRFPQLVPVHPAMRGVSDSISALAYFRALPAVSYSSNTLDRPFAPRSQGVDSGRPGAPLEVFVCVGKADPVLGEGVMQALAKKAWGESTGYWWHVIDDGGHFVQEWCAHLPALADEAFARPPEGSVQQGDKRAEWRPAADRASSSDSKL